ncbi:MAG TPA: hypothetical protein VMZ30_02945 [Pyrinomonadaceae bacterium]|nr:hypothetical protein [Pyrinomonadaceae bacterium]
MKRSQRAMQIWQILISAAHNRQILTYKIVGKFTGMGSGTQSQTLDMIMRYCKRNHLPPLTSLVVKKTTGRPGTGLTTVGNLDRDRERVFAENWFGLPPVTIADLEIKD